MSTDNQTAINALLADLKRAGGSYADSAHKQLTEIQELDRERGANLPKIKRILDTLERNLERTSVPHAEPIRAWLTSYRYEIDRWLLSARQQFGAELADKLRPLSIILQGQAPLLRAGLFSIELSSEQGKVEIWYGPNQERMGDAPMIASEVSKRIEQIGRKLGSGLEPPNLIAKLETAIRRVPQIEGHRGVPIGAVLPELAFQIQEATFYLNPVREHYRSYSRADFSYDIFRCNEDDRIRKRIHLDVATRIHTARKTDYIWVPSDRTGRGTRFSHIIIEEARP